MVYQFSLSLCFHCIESTVSRISIFGWTVYNQLTSITAVSCPAQSTGAVSCDRVTQSSITAVTALSTVLSKPALRTTWDTITSAYFIETQQNITQSLHHHTRIQSDLCHSLPLAGPLCTRICLWPDRSGPLHHTKPLVHSLARNALMDRL